MVYTAKVSVQSKHTRPTFENITQNVRDSAVYAEKMKANAGKHFGNGVDNGAVKEQQKFFHSP